jgi:hypothetical protein
MQANDVLNGVTHEWGNTITAPDFMRGSIKSMSTAAYVPASLHLWLKQNSWLELESSKKNVTTCQTMFSAKPETPVLVRRYCGKS